MCYAMRDVRANQLTDLFTIAYDITAIIVNHFMVALMMVSSQCEWVISSSLKNDVTFIWDKEMTTATAKNDCRVNQFH